MTLTKHKIQSYLNTKTPISYDREKLRETLRRSQAAFCENEAQYALSSLEFFCQQSCYIRKRWWLFQGCVLLLLWFLLQLSGSSFFLEKCMGTAAPLFAVLILPELWKNRNVNALEIECTACYSLRQIYGARIFFFALVDLLLLSAFSLSALLTGTLCAEELIFQFFLPYLITCCICFHTLYSQKIASEAFAVFLCMVWCVLWTQLVLQEDFYNIISPPLWSLMTAMAVIFLGACIRKGQKSCQAIWEVKTQWN